MPTHGPKHKHYITIEEMPAIIKRAKRSPIFRAAWEKSDPYAAYDY